MTDLVIPYVPRKEFLSFHSRSTRFAVMVAHRRAGKTVACVNELIGRAARSTKKRPRYAYIGPLLKQAKKTAWEYLKEYTNGLTSKKPSESELYIRLKHNDAEVGIYGADNPDSFRGQYFDGVVLDEYGDMSPSLWGAVILPTLADRRGWAAFIGTFKGRNHFYRIHRRAQGLDLLPSEDVAFIVSNWFHYTLPVYQSSILSPEEIQLQKSEMEDDEFDQEYNCNPNAVVKGAYYVKQIAEAEAQGRCPDEAVSWDPELPVNVHSDLGVGDSTAMWWSQKHPDGYAIIHYEEAAGKNLAYWYEKLREHPYAYGRIMLPHDARARTLQTGKSTIELFLEEDEANPFRRHHTSSGHLIDLVPKLAIQDGINAVRDTLPVCHFAPQTQDGIECLRAYKREWDEDKKVFREAPNHDWASHGSDAFRYFAVDSGVLVSKALDKEQKELAELDARRRQIPEIAMNQYQLENLWAERDRVVSMSRRRI